MIRKLLMHRDSVSIQKGYMNRNLLKTLYFLVPLHYNKRNKWLISTDPVKDPSISCGAGLNWDCSMGRRQNRIILETGEILKGGPYEAG